MTYWVLENLTEKRFWNQRFVRKLIGAAPYMLISILMLLLFLLPVEKGYLFGSEGDWFSQHVSIAETLRQTMLGQGTIFPQFISIGGGINAYDLAYYGLLRPDVLLSCLFPQIEMKYIISAYALSGVILSVNLFFFWMRKKGLSALIAFCAALIFGAANCFFQAHHQIIFVNYMPFLILALFGIDLLVEKGKMTLLVLSMFLICIHSFFYAPTCIMACLLYGLQRLRNLKDSCPEEMDRKRLGKTRATLLGKGTLACVLGVAMAAVLLLPTVLDILSTEKDAGSFSQWSQLFLNLKLDSLLYIPYGCGMSVIALYCLLLSLSRKESRFLSAALLLCLLLPLVSYVLSGFLYCRGKVLIPLTPLIAWLCADTLEKIRFNRQKVLLLPLLLCFLPALFSKWQLLILLDGGLLVVWAIIQRTPKISKKVKVGFMLLLLLVPICVNYGVAKETEAYLSTSDVRQSRFSFGTITMIAADPQYRFDYLSNNYVNSNLLPDNGVQKTAIYSSVSNSLYGDFYYRIMHNPISLRNRVVLMPNQNSAFNYFMGIRYVLTGENQLPAGYRVIFRKDGYVLAENRDVLPVCYGIYDLPSEEEYRKMNDPERIAALCGVSSREENPEQFFKGSFPTLARKNEDLSIDLPLREKLQDRLLYISFEIEREDGRQVCVTINGMKNLLSSESAPYPNENYEFTFVLSSERELSRLKIDLTKGNYKINHLKVYTMDMPSVKNQEISPAVPEENFRGNNEAVFRGSVEMKRDGYFVTSYPYKKGYVFRADGKEVSPQKVNLAFTGIPLSAGAHEIEISYTAPGFQAGAAVSFAAAVLALILMVMEIGPVARKTFRERRGKQ